MTWLPFIAALVLIALLIAALWWAATRQQVGDGQPDPSEFDAFWGGY